MKKMNRLFICITLLVIIGLARRNEAAVETEGIRYHLKWVTKELILPIFLEKMFPNTTTSTSNEQFDSSDDASESSSSDEIEYRWFKHPQNAYVDEIEDEPNVYLLSKAADRAILYIVKYNVSTHEQLATYEPRRTDYDDENRILVEPTNDLFTLAYVDGHSIVVTDSANDLVAHCNVSILMPNNNGHLNAINLKLIEKNVNLSIGFAKHHHRHHHKQQPIGKDGGRGPTAKIVNHRSKRSYTNRGGSSGEVQRRSLVQVNLDIGPIFIPKAQLSPSNNPELTCSLDLLDIDQNIVVQHYQLRRPIDEVLETMSKSRDATAGLLRTTTTRSHHPNYIKDGSSSSNLLQPFYLLSIISSLLLTFCYF